MPVQGPQDFWQVGARVLMMKQKTTNEEVLDLGVIQSVTPNFEIEKVTLDDPNGGVKTRVAETVTSQTESYSVQLSNFNLDNLALVFGASAVKTFTQAATPVVDVPHTAKLGRLLKLVDASKVPVYSITSIEAVTDVPGTTTYVKDTDWEIVDLERGLIRIISGGAIADDEVLHIDYTPAALTGNRLLNPLTGSGTVNAFIMIMLGRGGNARQSVREFSAAISVESVDLQVDDFSSFVLTITVLSDSTDVVSPAGRLLHFKGAVLPLS